MITGEFLSMCRGIMVLTRDGMVVMMCLLSVRKSWWHMESLTPSMGMSGHMQAYEKTKLSCRLQYKTIHIVFKDNVKTLTDEIVTSMRK